MNLTDDVAGGGCAAALVGGEAPVPLPDLGLGDQADAQELREHPCIDLVGLDLHVADGL